VANRHKAVSKTSNAGRADEKKRKLVNSIDRLAEEVWLRQTRNEDESSPPLEFLDAEPGVLTQGLVLGRNAVFGFMGTAAKSISPELEHRISAIYKVLHAYGLLENLSVEVLQSLLSDIARVLTVEAKDGA
jgi:hypothetical protein